MEGGCMFPLKRNFFKILNVPLVFHLHFSKELIHFAILRSKFRVHNPLLSLNIIFLINATSQA
jgi:hypothetical protein